MEDLKTYPKKRLSIIIEAPFLNRLLDILDGLDVPGYTVLPALAGRGKSGAWRRDSLSSDSGRMVQVLIVLDAARVPAVLSAVRGVLERQIGIVSLMDVEVLRPDLF
jgi:PII-like signaling protein